MSVGVDNKVLGSMTILQVAEAISLGAHGREAGRIARADALAKRLGPSRTRRDVLQPELARDICRSALETKGWSPNLCEMREQDLGNGPVLVLGGPLDIDTVAKSFVLRGIAEADAAFARDNTKIVLDDTWYSPEMIQRVFEVVQALPAYRSGMKAYWRQDYQIRHVELGKAKGAAWISPDTMSLVREWHPEGIKVFRREGGVSAGDRQYETFYARGVFGPVLAEMAKTAVGQRTPPAGYFSIALVAEQLDVDIAAAHKCMMELAGMDQVGVGFYGAQGVSGHSVTVEPCFSREMVDLAKRYIAWEPGTMTKGDENQGANLYCSRTRFADMSNEFI